MKEQNILEKSWQSIPKTNPDLPNWICWDKNQGKYIIFFEECKFSKRGICL